MEKLEWILSGPDYHVYYFEKNKEAVYAKILEMNRILDRNRIKFRVVILPVFPQDARSYDDYPLFEIHEEIRNFLAKSHIRFLDLLPSFYKQGKAPRNFAYDIWHPNSQGHRLIAQQLLSFLLLEEDPRQNLTKIVRHHSSCIKHM